MRRWLGGAGASVVLASAPFAGCGGQSTEEPAPPMNATDGSVARPRLDAALRPDASCEVIIDTPPLQPAQHVPVNTPIQYSSNPPSSGPHYAIWAAYTEYAQAVDSRYLVHNLEHGALVLQYKCAGDCPDTVKALRQVRDAIPDDPLCTSRGDGLRVRVIIAPSPDLDVPVAASVWGWTYKAQCVDIPTLTAFAREHYGQGEEATCANGQAVF